MHKVFGIRHHGPGSAKSLKKALAEMRPDCILIEGPLDAENIIHHVANEKLTPPVAMLIYNPKLPSQASYFPFARFSPEWEAMRYGLAHDVPVRFMDLPQGIHFTLDTQAAEDQQLSLPEAPVEDGEDDKQVIHDPLGYAARLAGYQDSERWWEVTFEQREGHAETFDAVMELMTALRTELGKQETPRTLLREAHMRKIIRKAVREKFQRIAVVCGAWHGPVLTDLKAFKVGDDNKLLRGIKKTSTKATWVPWTYDRLAMSSGYGAGVVSPAWYRMLYSNRKNVAVRWMTKVARLFRGEDLDASSAHVIEAVRLAETLTALRGLSIPGMSELYEAAVTIFCQGYDSPMELVKKKLIIGDVMGKVPREIPTIPLQQDLEKQIKSVRMGKYRNSLEPEERILDLRLDIQLKASRLLHRMSIIGIPWGKVKELRQRLTGRTQGDFKEAWKLRWRPDFAINVIEAGMWGNTVEEAASQVVLAKSLEAEGLPELSALLGQSMKADLPEVMERLMPTFNKLAATTTDITRLMESLPGLVSMLRYANTRQINPDSIQRQLDQIIPRICIGLPNACVSLNEDAATGMFELLSQTDYQISLIDQKGHSSAWVAALGKLGLKDNVNGIIRGACVRILYDRKNVGREEVGQRMARALSRGNGALEAAYWIAGFLHGSGLILIHDPALWGVIDEWVDGVPDKVFQDILPVLRRTFSRFPRGERERMMQLALKGGDMAKEAASAEQPPEWDDERAGKVLPGLRLLLG